MPHMILLKCSKNTLPKNGGYIYINVDSIHSIKPQDSGSVVSFGNGESAFVEHRPTDIVHSLDNNYVLVEDGQSLEG
jgi:hypothetical protein